MKIKCTNLVKTKLISSTECIGQIIFVPLNNDMFILKLISKNLTF